MIIPFVCGLIYMNTFRELRNKPEAEVNIQVA